MDDLAKKLQEILASPQGQQQLKDAIQALGLDGSGQSAQQRPSHQRDGPGQNSFPPRQSTANGQHSRGPQRRTSNTQGYNSRQNGTGGVQNSSDMQNSGQADTSSQEPANENTGIDWEAAASMLQGLLGNSNTSDGNPPQKQTGGLDMSAVSSLLSGLSGNTDSSGDSQQKQSSGIDMNAISSLLNGLSGGQSVDSGNAVPGFDLGMLMRIKNLLSRAQADDKYVGLLYALRPHMRDENRHKIDEAVRIMQLVSILPLLKESGLFGGEKGG